MQRRDFTFIDNVVSANLLACQSQAHRVCGRGINVAAGTNHSVHELYSLIQQLTGFDGLPVYTDARSGDVRDSLADITQAQETLGYSVLVKFSDGLAKTLEWYTSERAEHAHAMLGSNRLGRE